MSTHPTFAPVDDDTADLLALVADTERATGRDSVEAFLAACEGDARDHDGLVSVNRVRLRLADKGLDPRRYSAMWSHFTGHGKPMVKAVDERGEYVWETCRGSGRTGKNDGTKVFPIRRWVGWSE